MAGEIRQVVDAARKNLGLKTEKQQKEEALVGNIQALFNFAQKGRLRKEVEAYTNDNAYYARNPLRFNISSGKPELTGDKNQRVQINKVNRTVRGVVAWLNKEDPMVSFRPGIQSEDAYSASMKMQSWAEHKYDQLDMKRKTKIITGGAARHGVSWAKIAWDEDATVPTAPYMLSNGSTEYSMKGNVTFDPADFFSVYADPLASGKSDMRFIIHSMPRTLDELHSNKLYDQSKLDLVADRATADSVFKQAELQQYGGMGATVGADEGIETAIVRECFKKEYDPETGGFYIRLVVVTKSGILLRDERWPIDEFPFEPYHTEIVENIYGGDGVIKHIRPLQKSLNTVASQIEETVRIMGKLNWLVARGSKVKVIRDVTGDWIQYDLAGGSKPEQTRPAEVPAYVREHMQNLERWIDDISGTHQAFYGQSPFSRASGEVVKNLQEGDSNSLSMMRSNLDDFMVRSFKLMLKTEKYHRPEKTSVSIPLKSKDPLGQYQWLCLKPSEINLDSVVQVRSGTALPYSDREKQAMAFELWDKKIITDPTKILKLAGLTEISNTLGDDQLDIERQTEENKKLVKGEDVDEPVMGENHNVHIEVLDQLIKSPAYKELDKKVRQGIQNHRDSHMKQSIQIQKMMAALNVEPIKRSEVVQMRQDVDKLTPIERVGVMDKIGVPSDAAEIQERGGVSVEDPADAERQAMKEDNDMMDGKTVHVSFGDNHVVHMETHGQIMQTPEFKDLPTFMQQTFLQHYNLHKQMAMAQEQERGLVPTPGGEMPNVGTAVVTAQDKLRARRRKDLAASQGEDGQSPAKTPADIKAAEEAPEQPAKDNTAEEAAEAVKPAATSKPKRAPKKPAKPTKTA